MNGCESLDSWMDAHNLLFKTASGDRMMCLFYSIDNAAPLVTASGRQSKRINVENNAVSLMQRVQRLQSSNAFYQRKEESRRGVETRPIRMGDFGGDEELRALSKILNKNIVVFKMISDGRDLMAFVNVLDTAIFTPHSKEEPEG